VRTRSPPCRVSFAVLFPSPRTEGWLARPLPAGTRPAKRLEGYVLSGSEPRWATTSGLRSRIIAFVASNSIAGSLSSAFAQWST